MNARSLGLTFVVALSMALIAAPSASAQSSGDSPPTPLGTWDGTRLVLDMTQAPMLRDAAQVWTVGVRSADGGCDIPPPLLRLGPDDQVIAAQQVLVDISVCKTLWQVGVPANPADFDDTTGLDHSSSPMIGQAVGANSLGIVPLATQSSAGYYKGRIVDIINRTTTSLQVNVAWAWTGSCVTSRNATTDEYWLSGTGWQAPYNKSYLLGDNGCAAKWGVSTATYKNPSFCAPITVYANYVNIRAEGRANGDLVGSGSADHTGNQACAPLTEKYELKRTVN